MYLILIQNKVPIINGVIPFLSSLKLIPAPFSIKNSAILFD
jgi:hypothetical protein